MRFYYKYTPMRRGLTGSEYLGQWIDESFPTTKWYEVISDGQNHYGYIEGTGDALSKAMQSIEGRFSGKRLHEDIFIGTCRMVFENIDIDPVQVKSFDEFMLDNGVTVGDEAEVLVCVKSAKKELFKEISKRKFYDDNDAIADLSKAVTAVTLHYDEFSPELKTQVDNDIAILKTIYNQQTAAHGLHVLVASLQEILVGYYTAVQQVDSATTIADVENVIYE